MCGSVPCRIKYCCWSGQGARSIAGASNVSYIIHSDSGETTVTANQSANGGQWITLAELPFTVDKGYRVRLTSESGELLTADAIRVTEAPEPGNCKAILDDGDSLGDGMYTIDPLNDGTGYEVYCDMTHQGGGWTLFANSKDTLKTVQVIGPVAISSVDFGVVNATLWHDESSGCGLTGMDYSMITLGADYGGAYANLYQHSGQGFDVWPYGHPYYSYTSHHELRYFIK